MYFNIVPRLDARQPFGPGGADASKRVIVFANMKARGIGSTET
jgi:hypothetical protein